MHSKGRVVVSKGRVCVCLPSLYLCERLIAVSKVAQPMHVGPHSADMCHFCETTAAEASKTDVKGALREKKKDVFFKYEAVN